jgi:hypothetical protein
LYILDHSERVLYETGPGVTGTDGEDVASPAPT